MSKCFAFCGNSNKNNEVISSHFLKPKTLTQNVQSPKETLETQKANVQSDYPKETLEPVCQPTRQAVHFLNETLESQRALDNQVLFELEQVPVHQLVPVQVHLPVHRQLQSYLL